MGTDFRRILVAVDGSESSVNAARTALALASATGASVTILTVVRPPEGWWGITGEPPAPTALAEAIATGRREILDRTVELLGPTEVEIETVEEYGDPARTILAAIDGHDLVVVGRRGAGLVERMMMGSVADRLVLRSPVPVVVVP